MRGVVGGGVRPSDGNYGSLKGAGSYGSVPFKEPFKRAVQKSRFFKVTRFICKIITRIMIDCIARPNVNNRHCKHDTRWRHIHVIMSVNVL